MSLNPNDFWGDSVIATKSVSTFKPRIAYVLPEIEYAAEMEGQTIRWDFNDILKYIIRSAKDEFMKGYIEPDQIWQESTDPQIAQWRDWEDASTTYPKPFAGKRVYLTLVTRQQVKDENDKPLVLEDGTAVKAVSFRMTKKALARQKKARDDKKKYLGTAWDWTLWTGVNVFENPALGWSAEPETTTKIDPKTGDTIEVEVEAPKGFKYQRVTFLMGPNLKDKVQEIVKTNLAVRKSKGQDEDNYYFFVVCSEFKMNEDAKGKSWISLDTCDWVVV